MCNTVCIALYCMIGDIVDKDGPEWPARYIGYLESFF